MRPTLPQDEMRPFTPKEIKAQIFCLVPKIVSGDATDKERERYHKLTRRLAVEERRIKR